MTRQNGMTILHTSSIRNEGHENHSISADADDQERGAEAVGLSPTFWLKYTESNIQSVSRLPSTFLNMGSGH